MGVIRSRFWKSTASAILAGAALVVSGCGGGQGGPPPPPPPAIKITTLVPNFVTAGSGATTMFVDGSGFTTSSMVQWNGAPVPTAFGTSQILTASLSSALVASPGTAQITVTDASVVSNTIPFGISSPAAATAGVVQLVTAAPDGSPANGNSLVAPSISATGRYVAFQSNATNLVPGHASGFQEIYERDTCVGAPPGCSPSTIPIAVTFDGSQVNDHSRDSAISADGRYVAFDSAATNILPNTGVCGSAPGSACLFLRDTCIAAPTGCAPGTALISVAANGTFAQGGVPSMSPDARYLTFDSTSTNLFAGDANNANDVFLHDTCLGALGCTPSTTLVSVSSAGVQGNTDSFFQAVSATGRYVAFQSYATNLVPNDTNGQPDVFVRDTCIGATGSCTASTTRVDISSSGAPANTGVFPAIPSISGDGRIVAFAGQATNLVSTNVNGWGNVYVRDTCAGVAAGCTPSTTLASLANDGSVANCPSPSQGLSMTPDGRFIAFDSIATNLVPGDGFRACGFEDVFLRDTCFGVPTGCVPSTVRVSVTNIQFPETPGDNSSGQPAVSADGHYIVFTSSATNFVSAPTNGNSMVFLAKTGF